MWIEVKYKEYVYLFNSECIGKISTWTSEDCEFKAISICHGPYEERLYFDTMEEIYAALKGFQIALNGQDFHMQLSTEGKSIVADKDVLSIKPLKRNKDEALYEYIKRKEMLHDIYFDGE